MKKWPIFLVAAAIAIVGCGGGGGKQLTGTTAGGTATGSLNGDSVAFVNFPTSVALAYVDYESGQGRAQGDITAHIGSANLINSATGATLQDALPKTLDLMLNAYSHQAQPLDLTIADTNGNSSFYDTFVLNVPSIQVQVDNSGTFGPPITGPNGTFFINDANGGQVFTPGTSGSFAATIGLFPGRITAIQVFLNDGSIALDQQSGNYLFNRSVFLAANTTSDNPKIRGFLSDYVQFDISHVANAPKLTDGTTATRVYFSGEDRRYAASGTTVGGLFNVYIPTTVTDTNGVPFGTLTGTFKGPDSLPTPPTGVAPITQGGTYTIRDPDPRDLSGLSAVTSLQGVWRPVNTVISGMGAFEVVLMPHITDDNNQDMIVMVRDANGNITDMYFGIADLGSLTFTVFPIANVSSGADTNAITGTLSGLLNGSGTSTTSPSSVRSGRYHFAGTLPAGFKTDGRFIDFRI